MKFASFDLEIAKTDIPEDLECWDDLGPLGITCAAVAFSDKEPIAFWRAKGRLPKEKCIKMVHTFMALVDDGYTFLTWNGLSFDFKVLAEESGMYEECAEIALHHHVDMMMLVTFVKGWFLGLQTALKGAGLEGKLKNVTLNDGTVLDDMSGAQAPQLWADGEYRAVIAYLKEDVLQPLELVYDILETKNIRWESKKGNAQKVAVPKLLLAIECFDLEVPDTSWMDSAPERVNFIKWIPGYEDIIPVVEEGSA